MTYSGRIVRHGQAILDEVAVELFGVDQAWKGNFAVPAGTLIDKTPYELVLDDGRCLTIKVQAFYAAADSVLVFFDGVGAMEAVSVNRLA